RGWQRTGASILHERGETGLIIAASGGRGIPARGSAPHRPRRDSAIVDPEEATMMAIHSARTRAATSARARWACALAAGLAFFPAAAHVSADPVTVFDAHVHYSRDAWEAVPTADV